MDFSLIWYTIYAAKQNLFYFFLFYFENLKHGENYQE